jgi:two-component system sensor histidine kinase/response regulator
LRVLVVEDNSTNRTILLHQVSHGGMLGNAAENAEQALVLLRSAVARGIPYDVVITDMKMPGMDGIALAQTIKADPAISEACLVMLTSMLAQRGDAERARKAGILACLNKPVRQSDLYKGLVKAIATAGQAAVQHAQGHAEPAELKTRFPCRILVAEDNPINQEVALAMLESFSCDVDLVENGREAVDVLCTKHYDIVFMDCQMPEMDGFTATAEIRRQEKATGMRLPIIALTANAMPGVRQKCFAAGMDDYLSKPFKQDQLREILQRWLPRSACEGSASNAPQEHASGAALAHDIQSENDQAKLVPLAATRIQASPIDHTALDSIRAVGKPRLLERLVTMFFRDTPTLLESMGQSASQGDRIALAATAHRLKSSSANLGAVRLAALCVQIEMLPPDYTTQHAQHLIAEMCNEFQIARLALEQIQAVNEHAVL